METEIVNKTSGWKISFFILIIILSLFLVYYSIMCMLSPARKLKAISKEYGAETTAKSDADKAILKDAAYLKLLQEKAFLQSKIVMAETDSIYLTINLSDSTANVEISGVSVHKAKMSKLSVSKILVKGNESIILSMLASPMTIASDYSSIRKEPVLIKMAPKDTSEYKPDIMPDTSLVEPVNYILEMTNGTRIFVYQEEEAKAGDRRSIFMFDLNNKLRDTWKTLKSVMAFKVPEYHPYIKMRIPRSDAKIIYRAVPKYGQVGVYR